MDIESWIPRYTILRVRSGSHAYGTNTTESDEDECLVYIEESGTVFGVSHDRSIKHRQTETIDRQEYPLRKFLVLAAVGNPSVLEILWAPAIYEDAWGRQLRAHKEWFVGRHIIPRYRGYIRAQTMRLLGLKGQLRVTREELRSRDGYDTKYAMHCLRLGWMCAELLSTGEMTMPMSDQVRLAYLMKIRRGEVPFDEWWEQVVMVDSVLESFMENTSIPDGPNVSKIDALSSLLHISRWHE